VRLQEAACLRAVREEGDRSDRLFRRRCGGRGAVGDRLARAVAATAAAAGCLLGQLDGERERVADRRAAVAGVEVDLVE
jgi:hypothetical protein